MTKIIRYTLRFYSVFQVSKFLVFQLNNEIVVLSIITLYKMC